MKRRDVLIQLLHEMSGKPKGEIEREMGLLVDPDPGLDTEISITEYEQMLKTFRKEKDGIFNWSIPGLQRFRLRHTPPKGNA